LILVCIMFPTLMTLELYNFGCISNGEKTLANSFEGRVILLIVNGRIVASYY